jgi:hypothetical protein
MIPPHLPNSKSAKKKVKPKTMNETMEVAQNRRRFSFEVWSSFSLAHTTLVKGGQHLPKHMGYGLGAIGNSLGEHVRNLGTLCFETNPLPKNQKKGKKKRFFFFFWYGNSIPKIGFHYIWSRLIGFPKNILPIDLQKRKDIYTYI